jgi:hypothetical protein
MMKKYLMNYEKNINLMFLHTMSYVVKVMRDTVVKFLSGVKK